MGWLLKNVIIVPQKSLESGIPMDGGCRFFTPQKNGLTCSNVSTAVECISFRGYNLSFCTSYSHFCLF